MWSRQHQNAEGQHFGLELDWWAGPSARVMSEGASSSRARRLAASAAVLIVVTGGALFGAIQISRSVADIALDLHAADDAARAATIVRSQIALAVDASSVQQLVSISEATNSLDVLERSLGEVTGVGRGDTSIAAITEFADLALLDLEVLNNRPIDEAALDDSFRAAVMALNEIRGDLVSRLAAIDSNYQLVGIVLSLVIAGLAPLVFFFWARFITRRTMEVRELSMKLEHETELRETRSDVLRTVVHEFRTPLTGIGGLAEILESPELRGSREGAEIVSMIREEAEDMTQLTDDILASEGLNAGRLEVHLEPVDVEDAVSQVLTTFERRGIEVSGRCATARVRVDSRRFRQILRNLVSNAVKYGGPEIVIKGRVEGAVYSLLVSDDGPGVPVEIESRLFSPYPHRGSGTSSSQSVGLGLAIVKQLAEAMGGSVEYERVNNTTVFTLLLAVVPIELPPAPKTPAMQSAIQS